MPCCRSNAHQLKNRVSAIPVKKEKKKKTKPEKISLTGVSNAALGTLAIDTFTKVFTKVEDMPATKGDIQSLVTKSEISSLANKADIQFLVSKLERYHRVLNLGANLEGKLPYYDMWTKNVVYF